MNEIIIRPLSNEDVVGAANIKINGWNSAYKGIIDENHLNSLDLDVQIKKFEKCVGDNNFIVAIKNNEVVGFCRFVFNNSLSPNIDYIDCELSAIYVHPELKGNGIGTKMFNYVLNEFDNNNKEKMILWCLQDNINSIEFYKHMGGIIKEIKSVLIGDKEYREVGIVYNIKELIKQNYNNNRK